VREMESCSELTLLKIVHLKLKETCVQAQPESSGTQGPVQTQSRDVLGASRRLLLYPRAIGIGCSCFSNTTLHCNCGDYSESGLTLVPIFCQIKTSVAVSGNIL
jgi:hypothetical protein